MISPIVSTKRTYLRSIRTADIDRGWLKWINDPEITKYLTHQGRSTREFLKNYLKSSTLPSAYMFAVCRKESDKYIGNARIHSLNWRQKRGAYGRMIGEKNQHGIGIGTEVLGLIAYVAFEILELNRIETGVISANVASIRSNEKAGMIKEGVFRESADIAGTFFDSIRFGMTINDYNKTDWSENITLHTDNIDKAMETTDF